MSHPRSSRTAAVAAVAGGAALAGCVVGAIWAWIAPPIHGVVALTRDGERIQAYLGDEPDHFFVAPFLLLGLLGVLAVVTAALAWQWTPHRGPTMVAGLSVGLVASAALAVLIGAQLAHRRYGTVDVDTAPVTPDQRFYYFAEAPPAFFGHLPLHIAATVLLPAAVAAAAYAVCVTWTVRDDLGGYPPIEPATAPAAPPPPATVGPPAPGCGITVGDDAQPPR